MYRARIDSPFGPILLCGDGAGLAGLYFTDQKDCPPLADGPGVRSDSSRPGSGTAGGVPLRTLRPARRPAEGQLPGLDEESGEGVLRGRISSGNEDAALELLAAETPASAVELFSRVREELAEYFAGERKRFGFPLQLKGTTFQIKVWNALCEVPYGEVVSYGDLALQAGLTTGHGRPVGTAVGRNPVAIVVPCHRIIGSNRTLTGYTGGLERKVALLELEGFAFGR
ncbi:methylated-DNA-[protein]-cysteine S-methyltransferase [Pusillimonas noertemannii]|uniref:Methylated-DNA--protein-cysteine methyltransferase n=2 Tax=Pusillimonas noertemannii TaxID=305977 RepID=A0A2U1CJL9_9BURK|nr:methylated-DNA--[protein]-cysteine S-methyltransferase [Pusillimonas noertemannii]PVY61185.1 methylated-DNA-[protein]-cysteine S-methyltransferase [Pusillimonas noertemannii]TFL09287.1 methylated-DNA--[protein]-cysteine S-methyltransferase [Pusillimonas noertemannii]